MIAALAPLAPLALQGFRAYGAGNAGLDLVGIIGVENTLRALVRVGAKMAAKAKSRDHDAADEIVDAMRADVARRTGLLFNGITYETEDGLEVIRAEARKPGGRKSGGAEGADYAPFVEYGTAAHSGVADASFHDDRSGAGARTRRRGTGHPGTEAQPFFWPNVREGLSGHRGRLNAVIDETAQEEGF